VARSSKLEDSRRGQWGVLTVLETGHFRVRAARWALWGDEKVGKDARIRRCLT